MSLCLILIISFGFFSTSIVASPPGNPDSGFLNVSIIPPFPIHLSKTSIPFLLPSRPNSPIYFIFLYCNEIICWFLTKPLLWMIRLCFFSILILYLFLCFCSVHLVSSRTQKRRGWTLVEQIRGVAPA